MQQKLQTDVCVLDFSKAFDKVGHRRVLHKLHGYGIRGNTNKWIADFLTGRTQSVVVEGTTSTSKPVLSGVPQGSVLGPCLFLIYINDIAQNLHSTARLFADDTMIYLAIKNDSDAKLMQEDLDTLQKWETTWLMEFHPEKCEIISICRSRDPIMHEYKLHGQLLKHVDAVKYLGVKITKDLRRNQHIDMVTKKANNSLNFLRRNIRISNPVIKQRAYQTLVRPILEYSQTVWDPYIQQDIKAIEAVQRRAARYVTSRYRRTSSVTNMINQLEWQMLQQRRKAARLTMFYKIHNGLVAVQMPLQPKGRMGKTDNSCSYDIPCSSADYHKMSFFPRTAREWNNLPESIVTAPSLESFKSRIMNAL